ncbi:MAG: glycoside hydrolase family 3 C-terminal domain-containing protein, partial [Anaerolineaceae bacterium]|nr:glycoside hydrolase family 3 C-terminal domain-containing protein [Anaerolineaceae bacterium]
SEDPYLTGEIAKQHIKGVQSKGVGTSLKHFAVNNQEERRMSIDAIVDERTLREIYLAGFETAVKEAQPWTVMCSYNRLNGEYASENEWLLRHVLKEEWQHEGLVVTDWGAINDRVKGLKAGLELEMPGSNGINDAKIVEAVKNGSLDEQILDQAVEKLLTLVVKHEKNKRTDYRYDMEAHHSLARRAAAEGAVLLKNKGDLLPLKVDMTIAVLGEFAVTPRYQGAGSSLINASHLENALEEIKKLLQDENLVSYAPGYSVKTDLVDETLIQQAVETAKKTDVVVIFAGLTDSYESEGFDRDHMRMPANHNRLIEAVTAVNKNVVVVLSNGSPVEMPWLEQVPALLECYLGGQAGGGAAADILFGYVNPSGKLAETFPFKLADVPASKNFPGGPKTVEYRESIYVGYRYFDSADVPVQFPFGFGLSYTTFDYNDLTVSAEQIDEHEKLTLSFKIKNTGQVMGSEIAQCYVRDLSSTVFRPKKELKGFAKINLKPGEEKEITMVLNRRSFAYYSINAGNWVVEPGQFEILIGASSQDIQLRTTISVTVEEPVSETPDQKALSQYYSPTAGFSISDDTFKALLGRTPPNALYLPDEPLDTLTPLKDLQRTFFGRLIYNMIMRMIAKNNPMGGEEMDETTARMMQRMISDMPLVKLVMLSNGAMNPDMVDAMVLIANGKLLRGLIMMSKTRK